MNAYIALLFVIFIVCAISFYYVVQKKNIQEGFGLRDKIMNKLKSNENVQTLQERTQSEVNRIAGVSPTPEGLRSEKEKLKAKAINEIDKQYSVQKNKLIKMARTKADALINRGQAKADELIEKGKAKAQEKGTEYLDVARKKAMASAEKLLAKYGINREMLQEFKNSACFKELQAKYGDKLKAKLLKTAKLKEEDIQRIRAMSSEEIVKMFLSKLDTGMLDSKKISEILKQKVNQQIDRAEEFDIDDQVKGKIASL